MSVRLRIITEVVKAINHIYDLKYQHVSIKMIKTLNNIEKGNRTRSNYYRYFLDILNLLGVVDKLNKKWKILRPISKEDIEKLMEYHKKRTKTKADKLVLTFMRENREEIEDLLEKKCEFCEEKITKKPVYHFNNTTQQKHIFCSDKCRNEWIYKKSKEENHD